MPKPKSLTRARPADYPLKVVEELSQLEIDLGGRRSLVSLLSLAPLTKDLRYILGLLGDPAHDNRTLAAVCQLGNLLPGELLKLLGAAALHRGQTLARQRIGEALPRVVGDLMRKAAPYEDACHTCLGTGTYTPEPTPDLPNPIPGPCETCGGTGQLQYQPSLERQRLAIEMGGLLTKGGGISITNQQLNLPAASNGGSGALEQLQTLTDQILYGEPLDVPEAAVEVEILPDPPADPPADPPDPAP